MQHQINSPEKLKKLLDLKKEEISKIVSAEAIRISQEIAEREFDLFEFSLFLSSFGKNKLNKSTEIVKKLRAKVDNGQIDLSRYEQMLE